MLVLLGLVALNGACGKVARDVTGPNCADVGVPALTVVALDARSRQPIPTPALVVATDGSYADTATAIGTPPLYSVAYNRPGTYAVTLTLAGYQPWRLDAVVALRGACNVATVPLTAWLVPATAANMSLLKKE